MIKKIAKASLALGALLAASSPAFARSTAHDGIALSNSYAGNSFRQEMIKMWSLSANDAIKNGVIAKAKVVNADNSASEQESQIEDLILQGWKAIAIDAASPTALNGVIAKACHAGVVVVTFDSMVTAPCAYKVAYDNVKMGRIEADFVAKALDGKGNVLEIRGMPGTSVDMDIHKGIAEGFKDDPGIKIVGTVYGDWTQSVAQKQVASILPSLPAIQAVVTQGGDGFGAYQAFKSANRPTPLIIMGNRYDELNLWNQLSQGPNGYHTLSLGDAPGIASIALWVAQQILAGKDVPKVIHIPLFQIHQNDLAEWLKVTSPGSVATPIYTQQWVASLIQANVDKTAMPAAPQPAPIP